MLRKKDFYLITTILFCCGILAGVALSNSSWLAIAVASLVFLLSIHAVHTFMKAADTEAHNAHSLANNDNHDSEQMALFAELSPFPILRFNDEEDIIMANPAAQRIFDLDKAETKQLKKFITSVRKYDLSTCIERGGILTCAADIDDKVFQFVFVGVPERGFGQVYGTDITSLKKSEQRLADSKRFLRNVIDTDPHLIFVKDDKGRFTLTNEAVAKLYGTSVDDIIGKRDSDFNPMADEVEHFSSDDQEVVKSFKEKFISEEKVTDAQGNVHWLETIKKPLKLPESDTVHLLGVATDITQRKKLESQLRHSQKMEAIGQLAGGIAHDFNNLLSGVLGYSGLLKVSYSDNQEIVHLADKIEQAGLGAQKLTEQLLGFARGGKDQHIPIDLHSAINGSLSLIGRTIEKSIDIESSLAEIDLYTIGDPVQIQQIILNLAINARDAMTDSLGGSDGGTLTISTDIVTLTHPKAKRLNVPAGEYIELSFKDSGCGIEENVLERIFDPFFTTKRPDRGTGMGLSMVYGIVRAHGGSVQVESKVGKGSTFTVLLPLVEAPAEEAGSHFTEHSTHGSGKILVVDDHKVTREVIRKMLTELGYKVITAVDGQEGLEYYRKHHTSVDLLILDLIMPNMGAHPCFIECKKINPDVRAILMSGYGRNNAVQKAIDEGMIGFLKKPFHLNRLSEMIDQAMRAQRAA